MENIEENQLLQICANLDRSFVENYRKYCQENDFKQKTLIRRLVEWWLELDPLDQENLYRGRLQADTVTPPKPTEPSVEECIENIKQFVKIKLPSSEEQRMISALRKALGPEPKAKRKRG